MQFVIDHSSQATSKLNSIENMLPLRSTKFITTKIETKNLLTTMLMWFWMLHILEAQFSHWSKVRKRKGGRMEGREKCWTIHAPNDAWSIIRFGIAFDRFHRDDHPVVITIKNWIFWWFSVFQSIDWPSMMARYTR